MVNIWHFLKFLSTRTGIRNESSVLMFLMYKNSKPMNMKLMLTSHRFGALRSYAGWKYLGGLGICREQLCLFYQSLVFLYFWGNNTLFQYLLIIPRIRPKLPSSTVADKRKNIHLNAAWRNFQVPSLYGRISHHPLTGSITWVKVWNKTTIIKGSPP